MAHNFMDCFLLSSVASEMIRQQTKAFPSE